MKRSYSIDQLPAIATEVIEETFLDYQNSTLETAAIVGFEGDLGVGKTTLVKEIALQFGIVEPVTSPTFVIAKWYGMEDKGHHFKKLIHIDAYRIEDESELMAINFDQLTKEKDALIIVEWPERIKNKLSEVGAIRFIIKHEGYSRQIEGPYKYE